jgi:hypothetical protein
LLLGGRTGTIGSRIGGLMTPPPAPLPIGSFITPPKFIPPLEVGGLDPSIGPGRPPAPLPIGSFITPPKFIPPLEPLEVGGLDPSIGPGRAGWPPPWIGWLIVVLPITAAASDDMDCVVGSNTVVLVAPLGVTL